MLRQVLEDDLPVFFQHQRNPDALRMAASVGRDWGAYLRHWRTKVADDVTTEVRTAIVSGAVAGYVGSWDREGKRLVAYWFGKEFWGRGIATAALCEFLANVDLGRPLHAYVATLNVPSTRVLEKCGFRAVSDPTVGSDGVEEILFRLEEPSAPDRGLGHAEPTPSDGNMEGQ